MRIVDRVIDGKMMQIPCYGKIFVQEIKFKDGDKSAIAVSKCGGCEAVEEDSFKVPEIKHEESCKQAQTRGSKTRVYLQSICYPIYAEKLIGFTLQQVVIGHGTVWRCGGAISDDGKERANCGAITVSNDGGFPF